MSTGRTRRGDGKRKSEVVTIRLDPKLKYLAELAARRQRRTLSSYIEWAIEESLARVTPAYDPRPSGKLPSFADEASALWDVDEPDRFTKLAFRYPELLDHEEQKIWKLIQECGYLWRGYFRGQGDEDWEWKVKESTLIYERLREYWETFRSVARGEKPVSALPTAPGNMPVHPDDLDREIPF